MFLVRIDLELFLVVFQDLLIVQEAGPNQGNRIDSDRSHFKRKTNAAVGAVAIAFIVILLRSLVRQYVAVLIYGRQM